MIRSFNSSAALNAVNSVKYYAKRSKTALPYGFTKISGKVYQNENALPLGYTTAHVITRAEYEKLSSLEKQQTLLQGVVLDSVPTGMTATKPTFTDKSLPYTIVGNDDAAVEGQKLHIYKKKGSVTIQFTGSAAQGDLPALYAEKLHRLPGVHLLQDPGERPAAPLFHREVEQKGRD